MYRVASVTTMKWFQKGRAIIFIHFTFKQIKSSDIELTVVHLIFKIFHPEGLKKLVRSGQPHFI